MWGGIEDAAAGTVFEGVEHYFPGIGFVADDVAPRVGSDWRAWLPDLDPRFRITRALNLSEDPREIARFALQQAGEPGRWAQDVFDRYGTNFEFGYGGGTYYHRGSNKVHVDLLSGHPCSGLVHEATHTEWWKTGRTADSSRLSEDEFVALSLAEEVEANVNETLAARVVQQNFPSAGIPKAPLQDVYEKALRGGATNALIAAQAAGRHPATAELLTAGSAAGRAAVLEAYKSGQVVSSFTGKNYADEFATFHRAQNTGSTP